MGTFKFTLFFFLLTTQICFGQWVQVGLNGETLKDIAVQDQNIFAVTEDDGKLYRSTDNGANWTMIVDSCAREVAISQAGKIFMVVKDGLNGIFELKSLHYSNDNGNTWILSNIMEQISDSLPCIMGGYCPYNISVGPTGIIFCYVAQRGPLAGCGYEDYFCISTNDGLTWNIPTGFSDNRGGALFDFRNQYVITYGMHMAMGEVGYWLSFSSDHGIMWEVIGGLDGHSDLVGIFSNGNIILSGPWNLPGIQISTDMCSTWTQISTITTQVGLSCSSGSSEGILIGTDDLGVFLFSDEGDSLGSRNEGLTNLSIHSLSLDNNGYVYAGTENGVWRRPLSEIVTSIDNEPTQPTEFILEQNFPNPFNPSTSIQYQVSSITHVSMVVHDILGNEIETLVNKEKPAGTHEVTWYAENLPSGVYFYQLKAGESIKTKKMILLR
ncbi:MAG: T9SS type A sorting domain-containing protein [Ignavibacteriales bacterium]|nr:MAG: T9SS type A sorting domain-containing protein [Ignavibacteriales bacterium]